MLLKTTNFLDEIETQIDSKLATSFPFQVIFGLILVAITWFFSIALLSL